MPNEQPDDLEAEDTLSGARVERVRVEFPLARARKLLAREDLDPGIREALKTAIGAQFPGDDEIRESVDRALARKYGDSAVGLK
jgi:hypothetical protein